MGLCTSSNKLDEIYNELISLKTNMVAIDSVLAENKILKRELASQQIRLENIGMVLSGHPRRITPTSVEISARLGRYTT